MRPAPLAQTGRSRSERSSLSLSLLHLLTASYYPPDLRIPGIENDDTAYDALNSAVGVNFNTIYAERIGNKGLRGGPRLRSLRSRSPGFGPRAPTH